MNDGVRRAPSATTGRRAPRSRSPRCRAAPASRSRRWRCYLPDRGADRAWWSGRSSKPRRRRLRRLRWVRFPHAPATCPSRHSVSRDRARDAAPRVARSGCGLLVRSAAARTRLAAAAQDSAAAPAPPAAATAGPTRSRSAPARWAPSGARSCCPAGGRPSSAGSSPPASSSPGKGTTLGMSLKTRHELAYLRRTNSERAEDKRREHEDWLVLLASTICSPGLEAYVSAPPHRLSRATSSCRRCPGGVGGQRLRPVPRSDERRTDRHLRFRHRRAHRGPRHLRAPARTSPPSTSATRRGCRTAPSRPRRCAATASRSSTGCCEQGVKAVVIACNTSTAHALDALQRAVAGAGHRRDRAGRARGGQRPSAAGPDRRHRHRRHHREQRLRAGDPAALAPEARVEQQACPLLRAAGRGRLVRPPGRRADRRRVPRAAARAPAWTRWCSGCTHYPLLKPLLQRVMGPGRRGSSTAARRPRPPWRRRSSDAASRRPPGAPGDAPLRGERRRGALPSGRRALYRRAAGSGRRWCRWGEAGGARRRVSVGDGVAKAVEPGAGIEVLPARRGVGRAPAWWVWPMTTRPSSGSRSSRRARPRGLPARAAAASRRGSRVWSPRCGLSRPRAGGRSPGGWRDRRRR